MTAGLSKIWHGGLEDGRSKTISHLVPNSPGPWGSVENAVWQGRREAQVIANGWRTDTRAQQERKQKKKKALGPVWAFPDVPDNDLAVGKTADEAVRSIDTLKTTRAISLR